LLLSLERAEDAVRQAAGALSVPRGREPESSCPKPVVVQAIPEGVPLIGRPEAQRLAEIGRPVALRAIKAAEIMRENDFSGDVIEHPVVDYLHREEPGVWGQICPPDAGPDDWPWLAPSRPPHATIRSQSEPLVGVEPLS
jgi:hypothetical protein